MAEATNDTPRGLVNVASLLSAAAPILLGSGNVTQTTQGGTATQGSTTTRTGSRSFDPAILAQLMGIADTAGKNAVDSSKTDSIVKDIMTQAAIAFAPNLAQQAGAGIYKGSTIQQLASESKARATSAAAREVLNYRTTQQQVQQQALSTIAANQNTTTQTDTATGFTNTPGNVTTKQQSPALSGNSIMSSLPTIGGGLLLNKLMQSKDIGNWLEMKAGGVLDAVGLGGGPGGGTIVGTPITIGQPVPVAAATEAAARGQTLATPALAAAPTELSAGSVGQNPGTDVTTQALSTTGAASMAGNTLDISSLVSSGAGDALAGFSPGMDASQLGALFGNGSSDVVNSLPAASIADAAGELGGTAAATQIAGGFGDIAQGFGGSLIGPGLSAITGNGDVGKAASAAFNLVTGNFPGLALNLGTDLISLLGDKPLEGVARTFENIGGGIGTAFNEVGGFLGDTLGSVFGGVGDFFESLNPSVVCTELHKQGKLSRTLFIYGKKHFESYPAWGIPGYYLWSVPLRNYIARNPSSWITAAVATIFNARAQNIAAKMGYKKAKRTLFGSGCCAVIYSASWICGRFLQLRKLLLGNGKEKLSYG